MKFNVALLIAVAGSVQATLDQKVHSIQVSLSGLQSAVQAYTVPDEYAARSINNACGEVHGLFGDALLAAKSLEHLAEDVADGILTGLQDSLAVAEKIDNLIAADAEILYKDVEGLGVSAAKFVIGGFSAIEHASIEFFDEAARLFIGDLAAEAHAIGTGLTGAFHHCVEEL